MGGPLCRLVTAPNKSGVLTLRPGSSLDGLATIEPGSRDRPEDRLGAVWRFAPAPSGTTKCTRRVDTATTALSTNFVRIARGLSPRFPECGRNVDGHACNIHASRARRRFLDGRWVDGTTAGWTGIRERRLGTAIRGVQPPLDLGPVPRHAADQDLLNGRWLGHPLHAALTDIPIGMLLGVVILDVLGQPTAADIVLIGTIAFMLLAALSGLADYSETTGTPLTRATLHASVMTVSLLIVIVSALMRAGAPADRTVPHRAVDHRVPARHRRGFRRRGCRVPARQHGQPPRVPAARAPDGSASTRAP